MSLTERKVRAYLETKFTDTGLRLAPNPDDADFLLAYNWRIGSGSTVVSGSPNMVTGGTDVTSSVEYPRFFELYLIDAGSTRKQGSVVVAWQGEVNSSGDSSDMGVVASVFIDKLVANFGTDVSNKGFGGAINPFGQSMPTPVAPYSLASKDDAARAETRSDNSEPAAQNATAHLYDVKSGARGDLKFADDGTGRGSVTITLADGRYCEGDYLTMAVAGPGWGKVFHAVYGEESKPDGSNSALEYGQVFCGTGNAETGAPVIVECDYVVIATETRGYGACKDDHGALYKLLF